MMVLALGTIGGSIEVRERATTLMGTQVQLLCNAKDRPFYWE